MSQTALDQLLSRISPPIPELREPGPDDEQIATMIRAATRVPDHGRLEPWRFILYRGEVRDRVGALLADLAEKREGPLSEGRRRQEMARFNRAPLVIGVVSVARSNTKIPEWEMFLSGGAAAMNLLHAAHALGFKANWISNWYSDVPEGRAILGLAPDEKVIAFIHIGSHRGEVAERARPEPASVTSDWQGPHEG